MTPDCFCTFNEWVMLSKGAALLIGLAAVALAASGAALHEHDAGLQTAGLVDCDACHFRHVSGIAADGTPAPTGPLLVAHVVAPARPDGERAAALGALPTRGPPA